MRGRVATRGIRAAKGGLLVSIRMAEGKSKVARHRRHRQKNRVWEVKALLDFRSCIEIFGFQEAI